MSTVNYMGTELDDSIEIVVDESGVISIDGEVHEDLNTVSLDSGDDEVSISLSSLNHLLGKLQLNFGDESGGGDKLIITIDEAVFSNADEIKADLDLLIAEIYKEKADLLDMTKSKVESMIEEFALKHDLEAEALQNLKATNVENIEVVVKEEPDSIFVVSKMLETYTYPETNFVFQILERTFTHDSIGQVVNELQEYDNNEDGQVDASLSITYLNHIKTFDLDGNLVFSSVDKDIFNDGQIDSIEETTYTYDAGRLESTLLEIDNGFSETTLLTHFLYDEQSGDLISSTGEYTLYYGTGQSTGNLLSTQYTLDNNGNILDEYIEIGSLENNYVGRTIDIDYTYTEIFV